MELHPRHCIVSMGKTLYTGQHIAQSVTCLATDVCLTSDPGVTSSILVRSHTGGPTMTIAV